MTGKLTAAEIRTKKTFTTGQVAAICDVAPRTVSLWFDKGRLKGYRIPGSQDRRIPRDNLVRFLKDAGMPLGPLADADTCRVLLVGVSPALAVSLQTALGDEPCGFVLDAAGTGFEAGAMATANRPDVAVIDAAIGRSAVGEMARLIAKSDTPPALLVLPGEDDGDPAGLGAAAGADWLQHPVDPHALADLIRGHAARLFAG